MNPQLVPGGLQGGWNPQQGGVVSLQSPNVSLQSSPQAGGIAIGSGNPIIVPWAGQSTQPTQAAAGNVQQQSAAAPAASGGGSGYGYTSNAANPALAQAIGNEYDTTMGNLGQQMDQLRTIYGNQQADVNNSWQQQNNALQHQLTTGNANLDLSQNQLQSSKANSLRDLANQMQELVGSYNNVLGVNGAGNSSADMMVKYALGREGARNTNDINQQAANQQTGINLQRNQLQTTFDDQVAALNQWKQQQLDQLANTFAQQQLQNQGAIKQAQAYKAAGLAMYGQPGAQDAITRLQALDQQYSDALGTLKQAYGVSDAPGADLSKYMGGYSVSPISQQQLHGLSLPSNQASYNPTAYTAITPKQTDNNNIPVY